jgi:hypothetical protein
MIMSEANVRVATTTLSIIEGPQVALADELTVNSKKLLIVKGGNSQQLVARVLTEFSKRLDRAGKPFTMSMKWRGLCHTDPYNIPVRISGPQLDEYYLSIWYQYCELVHSAPPQTATSRTSGPNPQYLKLLDKIPAHTLALLSQSRFVTRELIDMFQIIE